MVCAEEEKKEEGKESEPIRGSKSEERDAPDI